MHDIRILLKSTGPELMVNTAYDTAWHARLGEIESDMYSAEVFNKDDFSLYPGWREYLQAMDALLALPCAQET